MRKRRARRSVNRRNPSALPEKKHTPEGRLSDRREDAVIVLQLLDRDRYGSGDTLENSFTSVERTALKRILYRAIHGTLDGHMEDI